MATTIVQKLLSDGAGKALLAVLTLASDQTYTLPATGGVLTALDGSSNLVLPASMTLGLGGQINLPNAANTKTTFIKNAGDDITFYRSDGVAAVSINNVSMLNANGGVTTTQLTSVVSTGTAPLVVSSTTQVANLNASLLAGASSSASATASTIALRDGSGTLLAVQVTSTNGFYTAPSGNLHLYPSGANAAYLNYYDGTGGVNFCNGASTVVATMSSAGVLTSKGSIVSVGVAGAWFDSKSLRTTGNLGGLRFFDSTAAQILGMTGDASGTILFYLGGNTSTPMATLTTTGGATLSGVLKTTDTTAATSTTTGSGQFGGGIGVVGSIYAGADIISTAGGIKAGASGGYFEIGSSIRHTLGSYTVNSVVYNSHDFGSTSASNQTFSVLTRSNEIGYLFLGNAFTIPGGNPSGGGFIYVSGGALKYRGSSGTVTNIANA